MGTFPEVPKTLVQRDLLGGKGTAAIVPPSGVVREGGGPGGVVSSFAAPQEGALTLQALMLRQKEAAARQQQNLQQPQGTILGGLGQMANAVFSGLEQRRAEQEETAGREEIVKAITSIDPATGIASPEILAAVMRRDPQMGLQLYEQAMEQRRAAAKVEDWEDFPAPEGAQPGAIYQRNKVTGEVREVGGASGTTVNVGGAGDKKWNEVGAQKFGERVDAYSAEGIEARRLKTQIGQLRDIMVDMPSGLDAKAADYLQKNWGISVGEGSSKLQAFDAIISKMVPTQRPAGAGPMSDKDIDLFRASLPSFLGSPDGNALILSTMEGIANYNEALGQIADQVLQIDDPREARRAFNEAVNKLPDPLAAWRKAQEGQKKPATTEPAPEDDGIIVEEEP